MAQPEYPKAVENLEPAESTASADTADTAGTAATEEAEPAEETVTTLESGHEDAPRRGRFVVAALLILALVLGVLLYRASGEIDALESAVAGLESELANSRATVAAHEDHLGEIRGEVDSLIDQIGALDRLVDRDPSAGPPASPVDLSSGGSGASR